MGTTVVGALVQPARRTDVHRPRRRHRAATASAAAQIQLLTRDHSLINDYLLAMPDLTEEQRSELPKNVITRALGMQDQVVVDLQPTSRSRATSTCSAPTACRGMVARRRDPRHRQSARRHRRGVPRLIARANEHGGEDNITALIVRIEEDDADRKIELSNTLPLTPRASSDEDTRWLWVAKVDWPPPSTALSGGASSKRRVFVERGSSCCSSRRGTSPLPVQPVSPMSRSSRKASHSKLPEILPFPMMPLGGEMVTAAVSAG